VHPRSSRGFPDETGWFERVSFGRERASNMLVTSVTVFTLLPDRASQAADNGASDS